MNNEIFRPPPDLSISQWADEYRFLSVAAAKLKEMKLAVLKKEYVKLEEVNKRWEEQAARIKAKLLGLPARLTAQLSGISSKTEINAILTGAVNEALNELAGGYEI